VPVWEVFSFNLEGGGIVEKGKNGIRWNYVRCSKFQLKKNQDCNETGIGGSATILEKVPTKKRKGK